MISLAFGVFIVSAYYASVAHTGTDALLSLVPLFVLPVVAAAVALVPLAVLCCISRRLRKISFVVLVASLMLVTAGFTSVRIGLAVRRHGLLKLAQRSAPLVAAIKQYEMRYGHPPPDLRAITPDFLSEIPHTGIGAYPEYDYRIGQGDAQDGNPWMLEVFTPSGILNFDRFIYYPLQNYPSDWCGQPLEPIGDWAYLHE
ncbi:MAG: hypothetical protein ACYSVY_14650 [Planctomycetota bacterium]